MPLRLATIGRQRTLSGLAKSLFPAGTSAEDLQRVEAALLRANPQLADRAGLSAGATVVVPEVPGLAASEDVRRVQPGSSPLPDRGPERIQALGEVSERVAKLTEERAKADLGLLRQADFVALVLRSHPEIREEFPKIVEAAGMEAERGMAQAKELIEALQRAQADQERLQKRQGS